MDTTIFLLKLKFLIDYCQLVDFFKKNVIIEFDNSKNYFVDTHLHAVTPV